MFRLKRLLVIAVAGFAALDLWTAISSTLTFLTKSDAPPKATLCHSARAATAELPDLRQKYAIYQHVQEPDDIADSSIRSHSSTEACNQALLDAGQYAPKYSNALRDLLHVAEKMAKFSSSYCAHDGIKEDVKPKAEQDGVLKTYLEAKAEHDFAEQHLEELTEKYGELCTDLAQQEFDEAMRVEL